MVYNLMKRMIDKAIKDGSIDEKRADYTEKLNAFYMNNQITTAQYNELMALVNPPTQQESEGE